MRLRRLDILGFKSFANKTTVQFSEGITAVVGPNGCGKTNILDALRWVLGEQKVTLLRGSKMEEVIFNGTRDMKPLGMSEVTLSLVNNRGVLPTEYSEVQVTRRLFRSGESEYLLNRVPCRLKDIHELFFDTGVGAHSYSVIQQDMIDAVISDKAEERRFLFEEAAGITKYKQRKRAALRKLEATEGDLLRLRDIYAEVQTQVRSLNRQQKKAQRYQTLTEDIRAWDLYLAASRRKHIKESRSSLQAELDTLADRKMEKQAALDRIAGQLEGDRREQVDREQELAAVGNEVYQVSETAHTLEREISILVEKRSNAKTLIERNRNDIDALKARADILQEQTTQSREELLKRQQEREALGERLREAETAQAESDRKLLAARSSKEHENQKLIELEGRLSAGKTEDDNLRQQEEDLRQLIADLERQAEQSRSAKETLEAELSEQRQSLEETESAKSAALAAQKELNDQIEALVDQSEELSLELSNLTASLEACQARHSLLQDMIVHYEGYASGVVSVMEVRGRWPGIKGTVAEKFVPAEGHEAAVEAALGELAGFLVCESRETAEQIVGYLKSENKGKVGVLVPDTGTLNPVLRRPELTMPQFVGWLDEYVTTEPELMPLMQAILARTAIFKSGSEPSEILKHLPFGFSAVSTDGLRYSQNIISGGSEDKLPLFRREQRLAEQEQLMADLSEKLDETKRRKDQTTAKLAEDRAESGKLAQRIEELSEEAANVARLISESGYRTETFQKELDRLAGESKQHSGKLETIRSRQYTLGLDFEQWSGEKQALVATMSEAGAELTGLEDAATHATDQVSRLQVQTVEARSAIEQTDSKLNHLSELQQEIRNTVEAKDGEVVRAEEEITSSSSRIAELEEELKSVFKERAEATERQTRLRGTQAEIQEQVTLRGEQLKTVRAEKDSLGERIHELEIRANTLDSEMRSITERIRDEHEVDIETTDAAKPDDTRADEDARALLSELKEKLKNFGAVNLLALEEYRKAAEREKFLGEQLDDLTAAKGDLETTISKINKTARELFLETFDKARTNFKSLFVDLFAGGEANIFLENPEDPLESDIQIIARPRGKKLLSITMMSGGERALTAIALLFGLYLVKPSPFCILDEIDAPLDDANCRRFLNIIDRFSGQTQFIIITHNKITMEAAHNLYGVTMEQPGISKLVAVKFSDVRTEGSAGVTILSPASREEESVVDGGPAETVVPDAVADRLEQNLAVSEDPDTDD